MAPTDRSSTSGPPPYRACFVCLGNICRSPMAEAVFADLVDRAGLRGRVEVDSAGTGRWHLGQGADPRTVMALAERDYSRAHTATQFARPDFDHFDLIVALDEHNLRDLRRLAPDEASQAKVRLLRSFDPAARGDLNVPDPYDGGPAEFREALELIEAACVGLLDHIRHQLAA